MELLIQHRKSVVEEQRKWNEYLRNLDEKVYIHVHGKMSRKEYAEAFAEIAEKKGYQTISFDLPEHGE